MIGTSAGSMVAAHLRIGTDEGNAFARIQQGAPLASYGRLGPSDAARYVRAQVHLDPRQGRALVGRAALNARTSSEEEWLEAIGLGLVGKRWPEGRLLVTAVDAETGTSVVFDDTQWRPARARGRGELRGARACSLPSRSAAAATSTAGCAASPTSTSPRATAACSASRRTRSAPTCATSPASSCAR